MELNVINELGQEAGKAAASDAVFGREYNEALVHQLVVAFPNTPNKNFSHKMNKKAYRAAMASILSKLAADGRLVVVDSISAESPKTKEFAAKLKTLGLDHVMIITESVDDNLYLASRNLKNVLVVEPRYADPLSLIYYNKIVVTKAAVAKLEEMLG